MFLKNTHNDCLMQKTYIILLLITIPLAYNGNRLYGSHVVGAQLSVEYKHSNCFDVSLTIYSDLINGAPEAADDRVYVNLFSAESDVLLKSLVLVKSAQSPLISTSEDCNVTIFEVDKIVYEGLMVLDLESDIQDYYLSWERCCRSYNLTNIQSNPPGSGIAAGLTAVLDFSISRSYKNTTPVLSELKTDMGCQGEKMIVDLSAFDYEGDSIAYSLVVPNSTVDTQNAFPSEPNPKPYPKVVWRPGFDLTNSFGLDANAFIDADGLLHVIPQNAGFYVYSVLYEEYRDGIKLSSSIRDFVLPVLSDCLPDLPEIVDISVFNLKDQAQIQNDDTVKFSSEEDISFKVAVQQPLLNTTIGFSLASIIVSAQNGVEGISISSLNSRLITSEEDSAFFQLDLYNCVFEGNSAINLMVIGHNNRCPQPKSDTLRFVVEKPVDVNNRSEVTVNNRLLSETALVDSIDYFDNTISLPISVNNLDLDSIAFRSCNQTDSISSVSFSLNNFKSSVVQGSIQINLECVSGDMSNDYELHLPILVSEFNECGLVLETAYELNYVFVNKNPGPVPVLDSIQILLGEEAYEIDLSQIAIDPEGEDLIFEIPSNPLGDSARIVDGKLIIMPPVKNVTWLIPLIVTDESCQVVFITLSVDFVLITSKIGESIKENNLFPNPNNGNFIIEFESRKSGKSSIFVYDSAGSLKERLDNVNIKKGMNILNLDMSKLNEGLYYITLKSKPSVNFRYLIVK